MTAAEIAAALGNARAEANEFRCQCPVCSHDNLTLRDNGKHLLAKCFNGCTSKDVLAELRRRGLYGKPNGAAQPEEPETRAEHEAKATSAKARRKSKIDAAMDTWRNSFPAADTLVATYCASRLILDVPPSLRFAPKIWSKDAGANYPAAIALIEHPEGGAIGIHCILLNPLDAGVRLTIKDRKQSRGFVKGGAVRLVPAGPVLAVAEGIEDALSYMQATGTPSWAAISDTGLRNFVPPPLGVTPEIHLLEDQDVNQAGQKAVADAARRLAKKGYEIKIVRPLIGKDINDALLKLGPSETLFTIEAYAPSGATGDWYARCIVGSDGRTLSDLANALLALREDRAWKGAFTYDELLAAALIKGHPVIDEDITRVQEWLQLAGLPLVSHNTAAHAIELAALDHSFHPVKQYLDRLVWDGVERLEDWLSDCLGVAKTEYAMAVGRWFLIAMIARVYTPGCQADHMLILEGPQGARKSTACRILAGPWFSDDLPPNVGSKDAALHLRGKWLIEISELHSFSRSEIAALKAFLSRRIDIYRPPYGRKEVQQPRQCVFIGTINEEVYLADPTGGRRFWPIVTAEIDIETLARQRDQLFAEAVVRYRKAECWWPAAEFETVHIAPEQEARFDADVWEEPIADYLAAKHRTTIYDVARQALLLTTDKIGTADQRRIVKVFQHLGWRRGGQVKGVRQWNR